MSLHPRGTFATLAGREYPVVIQGRTSPHGSNIHYLVFRREDAPAGLAEVERQQPDPRFVSLARDDFEAVTQWEWHAFLEENWHWVRAVEGDRYILWTNTYSIGANDPEWSGEQYNGWARWVDAAGLPVEARIQLQWTREGGTTG